MVWLLVTQVQRSCFCVPVLFLEADPDLLASVSGYFFNM